MQSCDAAVVFDGVAVDSIGPEVAIIGRAVTLDGVVVDLETAAVDVCGPAVASGVLVPHTIAEYNRPCGLDNRFCAWSIEVDADASRVGVGVEDP